MSTLNASTSLLLTAGGDKLRVVATLFRKAAGLLVVEVVAWAVSACLLAVGLRWTFGPFGHYGWDGMGLFLLPASVWCTCSADIFGGLLDHKKLVSHHYDLPCAPGWRDVECSLRRWLKPWPPYIVGGLIFLCTFGIDGAFPLVISVQLLLNIGWHVRLAQLCGQIAVLAPDGRLARLCAELRRAGISLIAELIGFPVILAVLHRSGLAARFGGFIGLLVIGFVCYTALTQCLACRRAALVLNQLADTYFNSGNAA